MSNEISISNQEQNYSTQTENPVYWCIYRITNVNPESDHYGWTYIGQHKYKNIDDPLGNYYGSGANILLDVKKLGKKSFQRDILEEKISSVISSH